MKKLILLAALMLSAPVLLGAAHAGEKAADKKEDSVHLIIRFDVDEARLGDFMEIMTNINVLMATEEGFIDAVVYRNHDDPLSFMLVEKWRTRELHQKHFDAIVESGDWPGILDMLTKDPDMSYNLRL